MALGLKTISLTIISLTLWASTASTEPRLTASWYTSASCEKEAKQFGLKGDYWGKTTASGEKFNENDLTCASWQYPFGTKLRVTNLKNGMTVVVKVTDRGPSKKLVAKGRVIDLSKGSFQAIAPLRDGVIPVKIEKV